MLSPVETEETLGEAEVRETFRASRVGTIAGCMVTSGTIRRGARVRMVRDGTIVYETTIDSLKRFKDDVREVAEGFECGLHLAGYDDVKVGDVLEVSETREVERTDLSETTAPAPAATSQEPGGGRLRRHPLRRAAFPREPLAEGEADAPALAQGAVAEPRRRVGRRGRST